MYTKGRINSWHQQTGEGIAVVDVSRVQVSVHRSDCKDATAQLAIGQSIKFIISERQTGRPRAEAISIRAEHRNKPSGPIAKWPMVFAVLFLLSSYYLVFVMLLPMMVVMLYSVMSALTLILYAKDKRAARAGHWRVSEFMLQLMALLCGWPGALIGRVWLRHKTRKVGFSLLLLLIVILNLAGMGWLFTDQGQIWIASAAINVSFYVYATGLFEVFQVLIWKIKYYLQ